MITTIDPKIVHPRIDSGIEVVYSKTKNTRKDLDVELKMLILCDAPNIPPRVWSPTKRPCIVWVAGGAWIGCPHTKEVPFLTYFAERGYIVASVQYRVSLQAPWPAQLVDVKTAIRYLRAHAEQYNIDPDHIAIMGLSAGGHLTAMTAMNLPGYDTEEWAGFSSDVQCGIDMYGPADLAPLAQEQKEARIRRGMPDAAPAVPPIPDPLVQKYSPEEILVDGHFADRMDVVRDASPVCRINEKTAPMLIMQGTADLSIPDVQNIRLHDMLNAAGHPTDLILLKDAGHSDYAFFQPEVQQMMVDFLDKNLK